MVHAFIMVKTAAGTAEDLVDAIGEITDVTEGHIVAGNYDIIAEVDVEEVYDILNAVASDIRALDGVADTKTYISMG
jgi:DNA-binding Lrp family transcriptional regulator